MFRRTPVPGTGRFRWHRRYGRNGGVSGGSRIVPHRYEDEGDKGPSLRRLIRRRETRLWRSEAEDQ